MLHAILLWLALWFGAALSIGLAWVLMAEYSYWLGGRRQRRIERLRQTRYARHLTSVERPAGDVRRRAGDA